ncbi:tryptophan dimethylallyltransferase family protein [Umezawaea sp. Da 62-37]|uniref:tryptophan dimethylallyltransferase family protein n=1 Tax=Umezawaea sp. Da 62-37 TaxID=3075927 RepID=UPI0028F6DFCC|nr:tryptophan dimethylallyltransferase family protein [Umezawaea sp. Da 62-37]WNV88832.1 tryptophan dimethylallyltransferase family protein [Umezawaea sp. Da 62-37]
MSSRATVIGAAQRDGLFSVSTISYTRFVVDTWMALCSGLGYPPEIAAQAVGELEFATAGWGANLIGPQRRYPSYVSRDGFPVEFSVSWRGGEPEVRVLFESLGPALTPASCQAAGQALTRSLAGRPGVSIDGYSSIEDLFVVDAPAPYRPTVWHSIAWRPGTAPRYKVYLNPQAQGVDRAAEVVGEAMARLGMAHAWAPVALQSRSLADDGHELEFFALDLAPDREARAKVYFRHPAMELVELNRVASFAAAHDPDRATTAFRAVYGEDTTRVENSPMTCLSFRAGGHGAAEANVYLRLPRNSPSDAESSRRITDVMRGEGVAPEPYLAMLDALAPRSLDGSVGLQELLAFRTAGRPRADLCVYLRCSVYATSVDTRHV